MKLLILKTDIRSRQKVNRIKPILNQHPVINDWSIDIADIDNVLRIEASDNLCENDIVRLMKRYGFHCEALPD